MTLINNNITSTCLPYVTLLYVITMWNIVMNSDQEVKRRAKKTLKLFIALKILPKHAHIYTKSLPATLSGIFILWLRTLCVVSHAHKHIIVSGLNSCSRLLRHVFLFLDLNLWIEKYKENWKNRMTRFKRSIISTNTICHFAITVLQTIYHYK